MCVRIDYNHSHFRWDKVFIIWSKDTDTYEYKKVKAVGLTKEQENIVTWIENKRKFEIKHFII